MDEPRELPRPGGRMQPAARPRFHAGGHGPGLQPRRLDGARGRGLLLHSAFLAGHPSPGLGLRALWQPSPGAGTALRNQAGDGRHHRPGHLEAGQDGLSPLATGLGGAGLLCGGPGRRASDCRAARRGRPGAAGGLGRLPARRGDGICRSARGGRRRRSLGQPD